MTPPAPPSPAIASVAEIVADMRAGRMVILVDEEDRENEGDLVLAADHVTPEAINFMARFGRGLICLTLTRERCERLDLRPMAARNGTKMGTAFTVSIEAAEGHTEAGCDLAAMAGCTPAAVICEIMKDDGTMARLPDLMEFAALHGLKIGTIADLIHHRSLHESLVETVARRSLQTPFGLFEATAFRDKPSGNVHLALKYGQWTAQDLVPVRVHEPLSVIDLLQAGRATHSWNLSDALTYLVRQGKGVAVLLNCGESAAQLLEQFQGTAQSAQSPRRGGMDLRTYGVGAQILRECGVRRMALLGHPRRMPSVAGYDLEVVGYVSPPIP
jgi:3,4-dihydroxy 2-butanone 4-phosphate synthase/GTP cyclohydrolase II